MRCEYILNYGPFQGGNHPLCKTCYSYKPFSCSAANFVEYNGWKNYAKHDRNMILVLKKNKSDL
jgi:hypothetical protein